MIWIGFCAIQRVCCLYTQCQCPHLKAQSIATCSRWLDPAFSSTTWPTHTCGKEVYAAVWTPFSNEFGLAVFSVLVPLAPYVLDLQPGGAVSIVLSKTAGSFWPCFDTRQREDACFGFLALGADPVLGFDAILCCFKESLGSKINVPPMRLIKPPADPEYLAYLGWCTWNSCYRNVSQDSIEHGLKEMQVRGIQIGWLLIDDGWQGVDDNSLRLESLEFNHFKFPSAETFIDSINRRYGLKSVGLWHTLAGYWGGVSSAGLGYPIMQVQHFDSSEQRGTMNIVHPSSASSFQNEYHKSKQKTLGACMFKIDDQSIWERVDGAQVDSAKQYQDAVMDASFSSPTIWCMAHNLVVLYYTFLRVNLSPWKWMLRSSDDYFPDASNSHAWHILSNSFNSLLLSALDSQPGGSGFLLDWDMFQTDHEFAEYHAIARAISNGPVYISDLIGHHDSRIVDRLCCADGRGNSQFLQPKKKKKKAAYDICQLFINCFMHPSIVLT
ncbi:raffinose synthase or seed imbibition protein Sip1-domain-containing protein [Chytriomyces cf. hyalinus JEL632]|nr:raffinose synthase or seed imbibition protein Sip1-domain-containing protein [Chytriomyces cf. hyalinus JEL632]